jgi:hypothetical protein
MENSKKRTSSTPIDELPGQPESRLRQRGASPDKHSARFSPRWVGNSQSKAEFVEDLLLKQP